MFVLTDFGRKEIKQRKTFEYKNHIFVIIELPIKNGSTPDRLMNLLRLVHYNSGRTIPIGFTVEKTIKSYIDTSLLKLKALEERYGSEAFEKELSKHETINTQLSGKWKIN